MDSAEPKSSQKRKEFVQQQCEISLRKNQGEDHYKLALEMSDATAGLAGIMCIITNYAKASKLTVYKVLCLLTVGLLRPAMQEQNQGQEQHPLPDPNELESRTEAEKDD